MLKINFFAFATLLLTVNIVSSQNVSNKVDEEINRLKTFIDCYGKHIKDKIDEIPKNTQDSLAKIYAQGLSMSSSMYEEFFNNLRDAEAELHKGLRDNIFTNKTECVVKLVNYISTGNVNLEKTRACGLSQINYSNQYVLDVQDNSTKLLNELYTLKEKADKCKLCVDCPEDNILKCVKEVSNETSYFIITRMNDNYMVIYNINKNLLEIYITAINNCPVSTGLNEFFKIRIAAETKACIDCVNNKAKN